MRANFPSNRAGFTLVEILIVIVIIGLLAGISLVALRSARSFTGAAVARHRLDDIGQSLERYKQLYGEYPPDNCTSCDVDTRRAQIRRHILKRWPNALKSRHLDRMIDIADEQMNQGPGFDLLFWLAGPGRVETTPDGNQEYVVLGFLNDKTDPIVDPDTIADDDSLEEPLIELSYDKDGTANGNYNGDLGLMFRGLPIVYFRSEGKDGYDGKSGAPGAPGTSDLSVAPYSNNEQWFMPDSFQLIYPGDDGDFGSNATRNVDNPSSISPADKDNVTNFTTGPTIESLME